MKYTPYVNWTKTAFNAHLHDLANKLNLGAPIKSLIKASLLDERWDPLLHYDGCTLVQDMYHPCLSCYLHDYLWFTGQGGKDTDAVFKYVMLAEGMPKAKVKRRWLAVRIYWLAFAKWAHLGKRNVNPYTPEFEDALIYIKTK